MLADGKDLGESARLVRLTYIGLIVDELENFGFICYVSVQHNSMILHFLS